jgi:hypothetical protein
MYGCVHEVGPRKRGRDIGQSSEILDCLPDVAAPFSLGGKPRCVH